MFTSAIAIVVVLGGLILFHEMGHYMVARAFGMGVRAFSLGFGPRLFGIKRKHTEYKLSLIPLGGYVQLAGEGGEEADEDFPEETLYSKRPAWQRMCVVAAGPFFNFFLAFLIYWFLAMAQGQGVVLPTVGSVLPDSPAMTAGIEPGDTVISIDGQPIQEWVQLVERVRHSADHEMTVVLEKDGVQKTVRLTPEVKTFKTLFGEEVTVPALGIQMAGKLRFDPVEGTGVGLALVTTWDRIQLVVKGFMSIIERLIPLETLGGPIYLAQIVHEGVQSGIFDLLALTALISINLGIINLLPIPVLDGGHILYFTLEMIRRKPIDERWRAAATRVGLMLLLALMTLAIINDFRRLLS